MYPHDIWGLYLVNLLVKILLSLFRRSTDMLNWQLLHSSQGAIPSEIFGIGLEILFPYFCLGIHVKE